MEEKKTVKKVVYRKTTATKPAKKAPVNKKSDIELWIEAKQNIATAKSKSELEKAIKSFQKLIKKVQKNNN